MFVYSYSFSHILLLCFLVGGLDLPKSVHLFNGLCYFDKDLLSFRIFFGVLSTPGGSGNEAF